MRGQVTGIDGKPIADVTVTITGLSTQAVLTAHTNDKGIFTALFPNAEGDYLINFRKIGFSPYNTRLTRTGLSSVLVADVTLKELAFELDTITVAAQRSRPKGDEASIGGVEQNLLTGALFSLDPTDLMALAGQIPGILSLGDSGFSVLGAGANANNGTIDGAKFGGRNVAAGRDRGVARDPDIGRSAASAGFPAARPRRSCKGGSDIFAMTARVNFADSHLAWTDPDWPNPIPQLDGEQRRRGRSDHQEETALPGFVERQRQRGRRLFAPRSAAVDHFAVWPHARHRSTPSRSALTRPRRAVDSPATCRPTSTVATTTRRRCIDWTPKATTQLRLTHNGFWGNNGSPGSGAVFVSVARLDESYNQFQFLSARLTGYVHGFLDELNSHAQLQSLQQRSVPAAAERQRARRHGLRRRAHRARAASRFGGGSGVNRSTQPRLGYPERVLVDSGQQQAPDQVRPGHRLQLEHAIIRRATSSDRTATRRWPISKPTGRPRTADAVQLRAVEPRAHRRAAGSATSGPRPRRCSFRAACATTRPSPARCRATIQPSTRRSA